ncbi:hypothetical protein GKS19_09115 [Streptococcus uberis]|nr:hypothetical protein [Streptococcus uberis]
MYGLIITLIYPIIIGCLLFIYFTTLIKSQINKNFVVLLEYFLKREAITDKENNELLNKIFR